MNESYGIWVIIRTILMIAGLICWICKKINESTPKGDQPDPKL